MVGHVAAFEPKLIGPYQVVKQTDFVNYEIMDPQTQKTQVVHVNRMHYYVDRREKSADVRVLDDVRTSALIYRLGVANRERYASIKAAKASENNAVDDEESDSETTSKQTQEESDQIPLLEGQEEVDQDKEYTGEDDEYEYDENYEYIKKNATQKPLIVGLPDVTPQPVT